MSCLTFLGLAVRAGCLEVGEDACTSLIRAGKAKLLLTASDVSDRLAFKVRKVCSGYNVPHIALPFTKDELGLAIGRSTAGVAAVSDIGMAAAFAQKLEAQVPGTCAQQLSILVAKRDRAEQRRKESKRHKENLRRGKKK